MAKSSTYICQNRYGTYYARLVIPKSLQQHFNNKREIRRSLQTDSKRLAIKRARSCRVQFETMIDKLMDENKNSLRGSFSAYQVTLEGEIKTTLPNGKDKIITGKIARNIAEGEDTTPHKEYLLNQLRAETKREEEKAAIEQQEKRAEELHKAQLAAVSFTPQAPTQPTGKKISQLLKKYCTYKKNSKIKRAWKSEDTIRQKESILNAFVDTMGDKPIHAFSIADAQHYINIAFIVPPRFNNKDHAAKFKGLTIEQLLDENTDTSVFKPREAGGILNDLKTVQAFFQWMSDEPDIDCNIEKPLKVFKRTVNSIDYKAKRRGFTLDELKILFDQDNPAQENYIKGFNSKRGVDKDLKYWLPLISLYSGATIAEICQLHLDDIFKKPALDGNSHHWIFDICACDKKGTRLKNSEHRPRSIPIHNKLIELGIFDYIDELKASKETKLFPTATRKVGGYGAESQWWGEYSDNAGVTDPDVTFHSFRHTLNNHLTDRHVSEELQTAISGHAFKSMSKTTYSGGKRGFDIRPLAEVINSIDYGLNHPKLTFKIKDTNL